MLFKLLRQFKYHKCLNEIMKKTKKGVVGTIWNVWIPLPNILINKGKYPQSGEESLTVSTISDTSHISQVYADKPK